MTTRPREAENGVVDTPTCHDASVDEPVVDAIAGYAPSDASEARAVELALALARNGDSWARHTPRHLTGSALVVDPARSRVLLRYHEHLHQWMQVGGHAQPGEIDPYAVTLREAREETGLVDLTPFPRTKPPRPIHVVVVPVPARGDEPQHQHVDVRYLLATRDPNSAQPEKPSAPLRWVSVDEARGLVTEANLGELLDRVDRALATP